MVLQEEYANIKDLQQFYAEQKPEAYGTTFEFQSVSGTISLSLNHGPLLPPQVVSMTNI